MFEKLSQISALQMLQLTLARDSSGMRLPRSVPRMGKYMPTVISNSEKAQKRTLNLIESELRMRAIAAMMQVMLASVACLLMGDSDSAFAEAAVE